MCARLTLGGQTIHLWYGSLRSVANHADHLYSYLGQDERQRASQFRFERDRLDYIVCRGLMRLLIAQYLPVSPEEIAFQYGPHGKPGLDLSRLPSAHDLPLHFNLSHSAGAVLFGFSRGRELGVDLEQVRPLPDRVGIAERFFAPPERQWLMAASPDEQDDRFFVLWTRKEAFLKATGEGIPRSLADFDVSGTAAAPDQALPVREHAKTKPLWYLREPRVHAGFRAAVCTPGSDWSVSCSPLASVMR